MKYHTKYIDLEQEFPGCEVTAFLGDIHGDFSVISNKVIKYAKNSVIFLCGDVGMGFCKPGYYEMEFSKVQRVLESNNSVVVLIRGNHDDPRYFHDTKSVSDSLAIGFKRIIFADDYDIFRTKGDHVVLCMGGATSYDRYNRKYGSDLFHGEEFYLPETDTYEWILNQYPECQSESIPDHPPINIIASHIAPTYAGNTNKTIGGLKDEDFKFDPMIQEKCWDERKKMDYLIHLLSYSEKIEYHFHGHYHKHCFYEDYPTRIIGLDINELYEIRD